MAAFEIRLGSTLPALRYKLPASIPADEVTSVTFSMPPVFADRSVAIVATEPEVTVEYAWQAGDTSALGSYPGFFRVNYAGGGHEVIPSGSVVPVKVW